MKLGPYELEGGIGQGGAGLVYRAKGPDGRAVAIKLLRRHDEAALARFERERRLQAELGEEDGFVPLVDWGVSPRGPYLVMPFVPGGTLRARLERGRLGVRETAELGLALASALGAARAVGVAHRDLKPENVLFAADGTALIADLGLAKHFERDADESLSVSRSGAFTGTAGYAAPEQVADAKNVGPRADVFALGAILWECLAGEPAFVADGLMALLRRVVDGPPAPLASKRPDVPVWLVGVIETALALDPARRFADGDAFAAALEAEEWGAEAAKRARRKRIPRSARRPVEEDVLAVPPSTAIQTEVMSGPPPDARNIVTDRPDHAPPTLKVPDIPFAVESGRPPPKPPPASRGGLGGAPPPPRKGLLARLAALLGLGG